MAGNLTPQRWRNLLYWAIALVIAASAIWLRTFVLDSVVVVGASMQPTLQPYDRVLVSKRAYLHHPPQVGDIIVFTPPGEDPSNVVIKRVVGVRDGAVFVLGDNLDESEDSRDYGPVPLDLIRGKVVWVFWPWHRRQRIESD